MTEEFMIRCAKKGAQMYAEEHPRPSQVNAVQAAEMLDCSPQTVRKMIKDGRLALNKLGLIPVSEIDRALAVK
jgi:Mn-dependent DtxR family transcriptional regulator